MCRTGLKTTALRLHTYFQTSGPIYSYLVALREGDTGTFYNNTFRGVVKISLSEWTKTYCFGNDMKMRDTLSFT